MNFPYFNYIFNALKQGDPELEKSFGYHVHWGYWENPLEPNSNEDDFLTAAENLTKKISTIADITDKQAVLDVGCGFGGTISFLNQHYSNMKLCGINIDERQLRRAKKNSDATGENRIEFTNGDACQLPFANNSFDRLLAIECIFHFSSREHFFKEALRVLRPGGIITLSDFVSSPLLRPSCKFLSLFEQLIFFGHCNFITINAYTTIAARLGLKMAIHDITKNTLPTYSYLASLAKNADLGRRYTLQARPGIAFMHFLAKYRLLTYPILSFTKT